MGLAMADSQRTPTAKDATPFTWAPGTFEREALSRVEAGKASVDDYLQLAARRAMVAAIARIAQHACREGEKGGRRWPPLRTLPLRQSWECVGETYADEVLADLCAVAIVVPHAVAVYVLKRRTTASYFGAYEWERSQRDAVRFTRRLARTTMAIAAKNNTEVRIVRLRRRAP